MLINKRFLLVFFCLILCAVPLAAQEGTPPLFDLYSPDPVIAHGPRGAWDGRYTDPGAIIYHDGLFHMFRNGFQGWPASVEIGYLTSEDGFTWTEVTPEPLIRSADVPLTKLAALASSVLVEDDGTWVLYFYTWNTYNSRQGEGAIGRATAQDPAGPWTIDENLVLIPGEAGSWDDLQVDSPSVVKTEDGYLMFYTGRSATQDQQIGLATSEDGITWTRHGDPILTADQPWETGFIHQPHVVQTDKGFVMVYRMAVPGKTMRLGLATSTDGITWTKREGSIWGPENIAKSTQFWFTALARKDDTYYLYIEGNHTGGTSIFATSYTGDLLPAP